MIALASIYLQVEYGTDELSLLGLDSFVQSCTTEQIRSAYKSLALRLHPDKLPHEHVRELHAALFQKVQDAYDAILARMEGDNDNCEYTAPKRLPETEAALHARNMAFKEALRQARDSALDSKKGADAQKTAIKLKHERLSKQRADRKVAAEASEKQAVEARHKRVQQTAKRMDVRKERAGKGLTALENKAESSLADWEDQEDRMAAKEAYQAELTKQTKRGTESAAAPGPRPKATKTNKRTTLLYDPTLDDALVSEADIQHRWDEQLLSGGKSGSSSLSERGYKEKKGGAARALRTQKKLIAQEDRITRAALTGTSHDFSWADVEEVQTARLFAESVGFDDYTDCELRRLGDDVLKLYLEPGSMPAPLEIE